ncbi:MAG: hypothetical protein ACYCYK_08055 [Candidatus Dormibacteria bacterium]
MASTTDLWIKVPNPLFGVDGVGFSVRYGGGVAEDQGADVPFFVEGEATIMTRLAERLRLFPARDLFVDCTETGEAYSWTEPIALTDEVIVMAFRDRSAALPPGDPAQAIRSRLRNQMVPLAFPFLRDLVRVADLRLSPLISLRLALDETPEMELSVPVQEIVERNGERVLTDR